MIPTVNFIFNCVPVTNTHVLIYQSTENSSSRAVALAGFRSHSPALAVSTRIVGKSVHLFRLVLPYQEICQVAKARETTISSQAACALAVIGNVCIHQHRYNQTVHAAFLIIRDSL